MTYHLFILGCQQNYYDAERIAHFLDEMGYVCGDEKSADLIVILACSVRQSAVDRIYGKLRQWKNQENNKIVILTACILPTDRKKLENKVDAIIKVNKIEKELLKILNNDVILNQSADSADGLKNPVVNSRDASVARRRSGFPQHDNRNHAFVSIMSGCNNFCTYCAVPYTRGREKSRSVEEIVCEAKALVKNGIKEITLLGQNVNSYKLLCGKPQSIPLTGKSLFTALLQPRSKAARYSQSLNKSDFVELLEQLEEIGGLEKISFLTSHPKDMSRSLIQWMGKSKKFGKELHLPVQSGDDEILKEMNRHYTAAQYLNLIKQIKKSCPKIKLSTDIIVGFPGETEEQFENTVKLCKAVGFDKAYIAQYSPRSGTAASKLKDNIPKLEKKRRWQILNKMINRN